MSTNLNKKDTLTLLSQVAESELTKSPLYQDGNGLDLVYDGFLNDVWSHAKYLTEITFGLNCTFPQKRQLFLELVEYYMRKGLLRFEGEYSLPHDEYKKNARLDKEEKAVLIYEFKGHIEPKIWDKSTSTEDVLKYFDKFFPKEGGKYPFRKDKYCDDIYMQNHSEEEARLNDFFYIHCPPAYWWDENKQEWIADE